MVYRRNQLQQPTLGQGLQQGGPQQAQFQQPQLHHPQPQQPQLQQPQSQQPIQQQPTMEPQPGQLPAQQAPPAPQQTGQFPQQPSHSVPGVAQQRPVGQQATPMSQPFGQQSQQGGQFEPSPQPMPQLPAQAAQTHLPQSASQPQQPQQAMPQQTQWGAQGSGQLGGPGVSPSGQAQTGQSIHSGGRTIPSQAQEIGAIQQSGEQTQEELAGTPSIDMVDTPDEIVLFVDLPGYEEDNIKIQGDGQNLIISAERYDEDEEQEGRKFARERPRKLQRTLRLPSRANVNEADASYENGVCKIRLPKMEEEKQHEIAFQ